MYTITYESPNGDEILTSEYEPTFGIYELVSFLIYLAPAKIIRVLEGSNVLVDAPDGVTAAKLMELGKQERQALLDKISEGLDHYYATGEMLDP